MEPNVVTNDTLVQACVLVAKILRQEFAKGFEELIDEKVNSAMVNCEFVRVDAVDSMIENKVGEMELVDQSALDALERDINRNLEDYVSEDDVQSLIETEIERGDFLCKDDLAEEFAKCFECGDIDLNEIVNEYLSNAKIRLTVER